MGEEWGKFWVDVVRAGQDSDHGSKLTLRVISKGVAVRHDRLTAVISLCPCLLAWESVRGGPGGVWVCVCVVSYVEASLII